MPSIIPYFCPNCGMKYEVGQHICKSCGAMDSEMREELLSAKEQMGVCKKCGAKIKPHDKYCRSCGEKVCY